MTAKSTMEGFLAVLAVQPTGTLISVYYLQNTRKSNGTLHYAP